MTQVPRKEEDSTSPNPSDDTGVDDPQSRPHPTADAPNKPPDKLDLSPPADEEEVCPDHGGARAGEPMEEDLVGPATVFTIRLKQPLSNLQHKMSVPELCRNFRCGFPQLTELSSLC